RCAAPRTSFLRSSPVSSRAEPWPTRSRAPPPWPGRGAGPWSGASARSRTCSSPEPEAGAMRTLFWILRQTWREYNDDNCPQMAAAIAYQVLFSIIPLIALLVAVFGFVVRDPAIRGAVVDRVLGELPLTSGIVVGTLRAVSRASEPLSIVAVLTLVWTSMGLFSAVRQ